MKSCDQAVLEDSAKLSGIYSGNRITLNRLLRVLNRSKVTYVLADSTGVAGWIKRLSVERTFDFYVKSEHMAKAAQKIEKAIPELCAIDGLLRKKLMMRESKQVIANLIRPLRNPEVDIFKNTRVLRIGDEACPVPSLEMALALKFDAMTSIYRSGVEQMLDAYEFALMVKHQERIDKARLRQLVSPLFPGASSSVCRKISQSRAQIAPVI